MVKVPITINKTFERYVEESTAEIEQLSKLELLVVTGYITNRTVIVSVDKPGVIEVRVYDLSNFGNNTYLDFNRKVKNLVK